MQSSRKYLNAPKKYLDKNEFSYYLSLVKKIANFDPQTKKWYVSEYKVNQLTDEQLDEILNELSKYIEINDLDTTKSINVYGNYVKVFDNVDRYRESLEYHIRKFNIKTHKFDIITVPLYFDHGNYFVTFRGFLWRLKKNKLLDIDDNFYENFNTEPITLDNYEFRDYQYNAVKNWLKAINLQGTGLIQSPTGSGKSVMALMAIKSFLKRYPNAKILYLTLNTTLLKQFQRYLKNEGFNSGIITGEKKEFNEQITNLSVMTAYYAIEKSKIKIEDNEYFDSAELNTNEKEKVKELLSEVKLIVFDEAHHVPAESVKSVLKFAKNTIRLGLTATPFRDDGKEAIIYAYLGDPVTNYHLMDFVNKGILTPPLVKIVRVITNENNCDDYNECKNIAYNDENANNKIAEIIKNADKPVLVLVKEISQLNKLHELIPDSVVLTGNDDLDEREKAIDDLNTGKIQVLIATNIFDEGIDIPNIHSLVLASGGKSKVKLLQRIGRSLRKANNKDRVIIYDISHKLKYFERHENIRISVYEDEKIPYEII